MNYLPQILLYGVCYFLASTASVANEFNASINNDIDKLTHTWITTEQSTNQLTSNWQLEKQLIVQRITILKQQNKQLNKIITTTTNDADELTLRRQNLLAEQENVEHSLAAFKQLLPQFVHVMRTKVASVPWHIQSTSVDILERISDDKSLSVQYQHAVDSLKLIQKNDKLLQVKQGMINVDNQSIMTEQLYLGNDFAWFTTLDNSRVGIGFSQHAAWHWQDLSAVFAGDKSQAFNASIVQAIKDAKHLTPGRLIELPIKIGDQP